MYNALVLLDTGSYLLNCLALLGLMTFSVLVRICHDNSLTRIPNSSPSLPDKVFTMTQCGASPPACDKGIESWSNAADEGCAAGEKFL